MSFISYINIICAYIKVTLTRVFIICECRLISLLPSEEYIFYFIKIYLYFVCAGMSWSFRISTLNKNRTPIMQLPHPHLEIPKWLDVLDLRQYEGKCAEKKKQTKILK